MTEYIYPSLPHEADSSSYFSSCGDVFTRPRCLNGPGRGGERCGSCPYLCPQGVSNRPYLSRYVVAVHAPVIALPRADDLHVLTVYHYLLPSGMWVVQETQWYLWVVQRH